MPCVIAGSMCHASRFNLGLLSKNHPDFTLNPLLHYYLIHEPELGNLNDLTLSDPFILDPTKKMWFVGTGTPIPTNCVRRCALVAVLDRDYAS